jgi:arylsulfatase A-like enzyme
MSLPISRRNFLEMAAGAAVASQVSLAEEIGAGKRPNILLMLGDDHRSDALGCRGNRIIQTPQLDLLAREGVLFENHFCTTPICCASRASIMLSQYAGTNKIYDFKTPLSAEQVDQTYWQQLKQAGYYIGFVGKFGVGDTMPSESFDYWKGFAGQGNYFPDGPTGSHLTHIMRNQANAFFEGAPRDRPFCLSISFKAPHVEDESPQQYLPSAETLSLYEGVVIPAPAGAGPEDICRFPSAIQHSESRRRWGVRFATPDLYQASVKGYYRLISGIDNAIGSMRATLSKLGLAENTIIIYSADHGIFNGEHGLAGKWYGHEESIRIPLIIHDPRLPAHAHGQRRRAMTLNIDLNPTVLELANLKQLASAQGRSLAPLLLEDTSDTRHVWFIEHHFPDGGWIPSSEGIRTSRWKYLRYTDAAAPYEELYDLDRDPHETINLAGNAMYAREQNVLTGYWRKWSASLRRTDGLWREPVTEVDLQADRLT